MTSIALVLVVPTLTVATPSMTQQELVRHVWSLANDPVRRPTTCAKAVPGTFGELADPYLRAIAAAYAELLAEATPEEMERWWQAAKLAIPASSAPPRFVEFVARTKTAVKGLVSATCAENGRLPEPLDLFALFDANPPYDSRHVRVAMEAHLLAAPDPGSACLDTLAIAQHLAAGPLIERMFAIVLVRGAKPHCDRWISSSADARGIGSALDAQRRWVSFDSVLLQELIFGQVAFFYDELDDETKKALPIRAKELASDWARVAPDIQEQPTAAGFRRFLFGGWARRTHLERMMRHMEWARGPVDAAATRMRVSGSEVPLAMTLLGQTETGDFAAFLLRDAGTRRDLLFLAAKAHANAFRRAHSRPPRSLTELGIELGPAEWPVTVESSEDESFLVSPASTDGSVPAARLRL